MESQTSLHAIQNQLQRPSHTTYYPHKPLIAAIVTTLHYRVSLCLPIQLNRIREHKNIGSNNLAGTAAKLAITSFERKKERNPLQRGHVKDIGSAWVYIPIVFRIYPRTPQTHNHHRKTSGKATNFCGSCTSTTPSLHQSRSPRTGPHSAIQRPPWWTIPVE